MHVGYCKRKLATEVNMYSDDVQQNRLRNFRRILKSIGGTNEAVANRLEKLAAAIRNAAKRRF